MLCRYLGRPGTFQTETKKWIMGLEEVGKGIGEEGEGSVVKMQNLQVN